MHTDYDQSALIWSCIEYLKLFHLEYFWILSRKPYLNDDKLMDISDMLDFNGKYFIMMKTLLSSYDSEIYINVLLLTNTK